jgi:hypothetical protein
MAMLAITWRNPKHVHHLRRWTHVKRDANRSLYLVLESAAAGKPSWDGLPTLEIIQGYAGASANEAGARGQRLQTGA